MKFKSMFKLLIFIFGIVNLFSFIDLPQRTIFYNMKLVLLVVIAILLTKVNNSNQLVNKSNKELFIITIIWALLTTPSLFFAGGAAKSFLLIFSFLLLGYFAFIALPNKFHSIEDYTQINKVWFLSISVGLVIAIGLSYTGITRQFYINPQDLRMRYTFSFTNPNFLGSFCYIGLLILLKSIFIKKLKWYGLFSVAIALGILLYMILLSDSRTPLYAIIIWITIFGFLNIVRNIQLRIIFFCFITPLIILLVLFLGIDFDYLDTLLSYRITNWTALISSLSDSEWFFGKGIGLNATDLNVTSGQISYDNSYISTLMQSGILGITGMLLLIIFMFKSIFSIDNNRYKNIALSSFISWLIYSMLESSLFSTGNLASIYVWSDLGILITINKQIKSTTV